MADSMTTADDKHLQDQVNAANRPHGEIVTRDMNGYSIYVCADCGQDINNPKCQARHQQPNPPTFDSLLNDPTQQLDPNAEVLARVIPPPDTRSEVETRLSPEMFTAAWNVYTATGATFNAAKDALAARHDADIAEAKAAGAAEVIARLEAVLANLRLKWHQREHKGERKASVRAFIGDLAALRAALTTGGEG